MKRLTLLGLVTSLFFSFSILAQDMSQTEDWQEAYDPITTDYIGGCSTHRDYDDKLFTRAEVLVGYFEPWFLSAEEVKVKLERLEAELIAIVENEYGDEAFTFADDIAVDRIAHYIFPHLDLYRVNIGTGGGNRMHLFYARLDNKSVVSYQKISDIFDGDVNYCDQSVWLIR